MTNTGVPDSALGKQLIADIDTISTSVELPKLWTFNQHDVLRDLEREKDKSRVLTNYVAYLLDRIEKLESRLGSE
jgi:ribosome assembly protein YihI (activator of Der GTPase)